LCKPPKGTFSLITEVDDRFVWHLLTNHAQDRESADAGVEDADRRAGIDLHNISTINARPQSFQTSDEILQASLRLTNISESLNENFYYI
jgi:hypothetical protein